MFFDQHENLEHITAEDREHFRHIVSEIFNSTPYSMRTVPTHTEDGIPIRKLYVSNLPPRTTRAELFGVFAQYGFIKSCWLRMGEKGPNKSPTPTYAFVTYSNPADAHKALLAPYQEKSLRGRNLRISPADTWHQPAQDADGRVRWKPQSRRPDSHSADIDSYPTESTSDQAVLLESSEPEPDIQDVIPQEPENPSDESYNILDILNRDCLMHIISFVPITDLIRSECVSKGWQNIVQEYLESMRTFKTSWWTSSERRASLTTAVLRRVLQRVGGSLLRLHIDHYWSALNDRTAHTIGKFCPNLEEFKVMGMHTRNWNPLIYGCKQLRIISFISCNKLTDSCLLQLVKSDSCIESLTVANNTHVTGLFLNASNPPKLNSLAFYNCYNLQGTVLCAALDTLPQLTTLKLDLCPASMWKMIPLILNKLPNLQELSLSESMEYVLTQDDALSNSLASLKELKVLNFFKNINITNGLLKRIAQSCHKLESLNIGSCNSRKIHQAAIGDDGIQAICSSCRALKHLDVSYLADLTDDGLRHLVKLPHLSTVVSRGNPALSAAPFAAALTNCHDLREIDVCGCDSVSEEIVDAAHKALVSRPRPITLHVAGTPASQAEDLPTHRMVYLNITDDLSNPHLRPDFVDETFGDLYDNYEFEEMDEYFIPDDDDDDDDDDDQFFDENDLHYEEIYAYGLENIVLL